MITENKTRGSETFTALNGLRFLAVLISLVVERLVETRWLALVQRPQSSALAVVPATPVEREQVRECA